MRLIDADQLNEVLNINFGHTGGADVLRQLIDIQPTIQAVPIEELQEIRHEIENNMESIIGKYDANTPEHNMPSHKIERNNGRKECLAIINKHIKELEESDKE